MKLALLGLVLGALLLPHAARSSGTILPVKSSAEFAAAIARAHPGDTIQLADGPYTGLSVSRSFSGPVTIAGSRGAQLAGIAFTNAANVVVTGVSIVPVGGQRVVVSMSHSHGITLDHVLVDGVTEAAGAWIETDPSDSNITVRNSELTDCGSSNRCIYPDAAGMRILDNHFHDCLDCDFIRGSDEGGSILIAGNTFDRAIAGSCQGGSRGCNHNDNVQIMGGGPWTIVGNRFGVVERSGASVFVSSNLHATTPRIHDVLIASNIFLGGSGFTGIHISAGGALGPPQNVSIVNNTILSGTANAVFIAKAWSQQPLTSRPLIANNIMAVSNGTACIARTSRNLVEKGHACPGDLFGPAHLDATGAPTTASTLVLGRANPADAPETDFYGRATSPSPDVGAIQSRLAPVTLAAPARMTVTRTHLGRTGWKLQVTVRFQNLATLRTRLLVGKRTDASIASRVTGLTRKTVSLTVPARARAATRLTLSFLGTASDGRTAAAATDLRVQR